MKMACFKYVHTVGAVAVLCWAVVLVAVAVAVLRRAVVLACADRRENWNLGRRRQAALMVLMAYFGQMCTP